jgi:hypothetical protein
MEIALAFIPLQPHAKLSPTAVRTNYAEQWGVTPVPATAEKGQFAFKVGEDDVIVALMPAPIPWSDLEGPCATSWLWPDAAKILRDHKGHLIVTVLSPEANPLQQARIVTQVCASILATCPQAPGVYWGNATLVISSAMFQDFARDVLPNGPPLYIWVDTRVGKLPNGKTSGFTCGMAALGFMEFETESASDEPGELRERFYGLGNYLIENGPVINDGDTIGEDENERIRVVYAPSKFGHEGKVMRLEYSAVAKKKGFFGR